MSRHTQDDQDFDDFMSDFYSKRTLPKSQPAQKLWFKSRKKDIKEPDSSSPLNSFGTIGNLYYTKKTDNGELEKSNKHPQKSKSVLAAIQLHTARFIQLLKHPFSKKYLKKSALILGGLAILLVGSAGFRLINNNAEDKSNEITQKSTEPEPSSVYAPTYLPDGYSIVSDTQVLDNGALFYEIYTDSGDVVSVTQQAKPADIESLDMFSQIPNIETRVGKGYIVEAVDRITGYILADKTMILFNSTAEVSASEMRKIMEAYKP